ncbi:MAG TPA: hypothetical protein VKB41_02265 [Steroidobacteraceae bacterium]|nr:hypothetical protein [Steroidobacteraceae bacterium]
MAPVARQEAWAVSKAAAASKGAVRQRSPLEPAASRAQVRVVPEALVDSRVPEPQEPEDNRARAPQAPVANRVQVLRAVVRRA